MTVVLRVAAVLSLSASCHGAEGRALVRELRIDPDPGQIVRGAYDATDGSIYVATLSRVYRFAAGRPGGPVLVVPPDGEGRVLLAPGGGIQAWKKALGGPRVLYSASLTTLATGDTVRLKLGDKPAPVGGLTLGRRGRLVLSTTPVGSSVAPDAEYDYRFWAADGGLSRELRLIGLRSRVLDPHGDAVLLTGRGEAIAFSRTGAELWRLGGTFRHAALGREGRLVVLNPAGRDKRHTLIVRVAPRRTETVTLPEPVTRLRIAEDGSFALAVLADHTYVRVDLTTFEPTAPRRVPLDDVLVVADAEILDGSTLAFGVRHGTGTTAADHGTVLVISAAPEPAVLLRERLPLSSAAAHLPAIDWAAGSTSFVARSDSRAVFVRLGE